MGAFDQAVSRDNRYDEIKHLHDQFEWSTSGGYATKTYRAVAKTEEAAALSAMDVALLADSGNLCFGGRNFGKHVTPEGVTTFSGVVYTD